MADIFHYFQINATVNKVFDTISTPNGIDMWWSKKSSGKAEVGEIFYFHFEPDYNWTAIVSKCIPDKEFELTIQNSDNDWSGSKVGFHLINKNNFTEVQFQHLGWKEDNEHYRVSNYCWAMYLRLLKRYLEFGEVVLYSDRLNV